MTDHYATLGVKTTATIDEIRRAFRKLAAKHHPDRNPGDKDAELRFKSITKAYDTLSDPQRRAKYDLERSRPAVPVFQEPDFVRRARERRGKPAAAPPPFAPSEPMELGKVYKVSPQVKLGPIPVGEIPPWMTSAQVFRKKS